MSCLTKPYKLHTEVSGQEQHWFLWLWVMQESSVLAGILPKANLRALSEWKEQKHFWTGFLKGIDPEKCCPFSGRLEPSSSISTLPLCQHLYLRFLEISESETELVHKAVNE